MYVSLPEEKCHDSLPLVISEKYKYKSDLINYISESNVAKASDIFSCLYSVSSETDLCSFLLNFNQSGYKKIHIKILKNGDYPFTII